MNFKDSINDLIIEYKRLSRDIMIYYKHEGASKKSQTIAKKNKI